MDRSNKKMYHIGLGFGVLSGFVLLPGDPGRVDLVLSFLEGSRVLCFKREFKSGVGFYKGVRVGVLSTGIGGPSTAIAVEELARIGTHTLIRIGTTGTIQKNIKIGDIIIATAAVRGDGTSKYYAPPEYPAVASIEVVNAAIEAAERLGVPYHVGIVWSNDAFYAEGDYVEFWRRKRVLSVEMEASTLFTIASIKGLRAGAILLAINEAGGEISEETWRKYIDRLILVGLETVHILASRDTKENNKN
ncbi:MAG: nucleoside phosphorylase [Euryarchaeota archaeon]|nr:nucleoside phosphorylase [Euryarchaeota archaeon]